ncbi:protein hcp1 [Aliidongia dinghuensis]|uniref:Protein hcp1 n=1 Tax=Aliidongia dinghuensis TaxID=1867774 RepID=A0A8J2YSD1_9PROT|nr:type VI secretion system tube protein Hcp [Aliidongia dinghuensis]GGF11214.1 protein hcp1 [Aliidongia dinghuensis]
MAVDMFLKLDGIDGEAKDSVHKKEIDILAWSWGISNSGTFHMGGGGGSGKANFQDISVTKYIDSSSNALMLNCSSGEHVATGTLTVRKSGGKEPLEYIKLELKKILVSSISMGGSGGEDRLTENVTLNFAEFSYGYTEQKEDGSGEAEKYAKWNIEENKKV